jgi:WD40 repeat protein
MVSFSFSTKYRYLIALLMLVILLLLVAWYHFFASGKIMVLSVASDGKHAISSDDRKYIIVWDLSKKTKTIISRNGNIYSAYFIKNSNNFLWQDLHDEVHVQNLAGKEILRFHNFPTYGQVMTSDLKHYIASNQRWDLYSGYGNQQKIIKSSYQINGFLGSGKLLNLTLSNDNKYLLTAGESGARFDNIPLEVGYSAYEASKKNYVVGIINASLLEGVVLWSVENGKPIRKFSGAISKTYATLSPDGKYVVAGDEGSGAFIWEASNGKKPFDIYDLNFGKFIKTGTKIENFKHDKTGLIQQPKDFAKTINSVLSLKFIDLNGFYLRFTTYSSYAVLFNVNDPKPIKYLPLGKHPFPSVDDYSRNASIDTAPAANILVMGKANSGGILVYKFDPIKQTLTKIWDGG